MCRERMRNRADARRTQCCRQLLCRDCGQRMKKHPVPRCFFCNSTSGAMYVLSLMSTRFTYPEHFGKVAFAFDSQLVFVPVDELFLVQRKRLHRGSERKDCMAPLDNFLTRTSTRHHHVASMVKRAAVIRFTYSDDELG